MISRVFVFVCVACIRIYQQTLAYFLGGRCRFVPSCSEYAIEAFRTCGLVRGFAYAGYRVARCHPFTRGGYDPVRADCQQDKE